MFLINILTDKVNPDNISDIVAYGDLDFFNKFFVVLFGFALCILLVVVVLMGNKISSLKEKIKELENKEKKEV